MINFDDYPILKSNLSSLKDTSIDNHDQNHITYMTDSQREAVNFDGVKRAYIKNLALSEEPKSNDALFLDKENKLIFVEFKNGFMDSSKKFAVRKKIYDSLLILTDILDMGISHLRDEMEYILVYNEQVNEKEKEVLKKKTWIQPSEAFDNFAKNLSKMANTEYVCFGIKIFKNYCFKNVHTYTEAEFETYLADH